MAREEQDLCSWIETCMTEHPHNTSAFEKNTALQQESKNQTYNQPCMGSDVHMVY